MIQLASTLLLAIPLLAPGSADLPLEGPVPAEVVTALRDNLYEEDIDFALDELEKRCGGFFSLKEIKWKKVRKEFVKAAKGVDTDEEHYRLLVRLLARLKDGHCHVTPSTPPADWLVEQKSPGFFLSQVGKKFYIKNAWSSAEEVGLASGMEVLTIDGLSMKKWLPKRLETVRDFRSFSTDQHALFWVLHRGFSKPEGERLKIEYKDLGGKKRKRTITLTKAKAVPNGPAFSPEGYRSLGESLRFARTGRGFGYIHFRRVRGKILDELDRALDELSDAPGIILDFRGNSGGGADHDALEARFVPAGKEFNRMARIALPSAGRAPYGGPLVVIVDGTTVSAGETTSGMFKEDGRAYMIGESATAGMSSQKETIGLPSGKFSLYVSVRTNRSTFNGGRGVEGIGVMPHEIVSFQPEDLQNEVDTLLMRAEDLLMEYPQKQVKYDPEDYGWAG
jgi:carboxyl-terminal processing protease